MLYSDNGVTYSYNAKDNPKNNRRMSQYLKIDNCIYYVNK